ncbi:MAG: molybdopterin-dependent oxidoreductase, partial [Vicinamibacterales bacterium]
MDRRKFIKLTAITGTTAALASCGSPENQIIRFIPEDDLVPGVAVWKPSICPLCASGCGVIARVVEGEAEVFRHGQPGVIRMGLVKKLEGNPADPISHGKLCPRGQAAIQVTYHPDRLAAPMKRKGPRGSGEFTEISWDDALKELLAQLDGLASAGEQASLALLMRARTGRRPGLIAQFLARFGAPAPVVFDVFGDDVLRHANELSFGHHQLPTLDLAHARYLMGFGADFLGTWNSPVAHSVAFGAMRGDRPGVKGKFVQVEPRMSSTGASADEWVAVRPGTEGVLALGLAHVIIKAGLRTAASAGRAGSIIDGWTGGLASYTPDQVEQKTGVKAAKVERLAREFAENAPACAVIGGAPLAHTNGVFQAVAVNALNALAGSVGVPGGVNFTPRPGTSSPQRALADLLGGATPKVLLIDDANPVYASPPGWRVAEAIQKIPFIASFGSFLDDTTVHADLILPDHSFLESWIDAQPESGALAAVTTVAEPAMRPLYDTRSMPDVLLDVSRRLQTPLTPALPPSFEEMLKAVAGAAPVGAAAVGGGKPSGLPGATALTIDASFDGDATQLPFHFLPYHSQALLDGSLAHLPWLQEMPDPLTSAMWSSWIEINPKTAAGLGIGDGNVVDVASAHG